MLTLLWFSRDLRLTDNPALAAAIVRGGPIVPVFVLDDLDAGEWAPAGASRWWLHESLRALDDSLRQRGAALVLRRGPAETVIDELLDQTGADAAYWNRRYEPWATPRGERLKTRLKNRGVEVRSFQFGPDPRAVDGDDAEGRALSGIHAILEGLESDGRLRASGGRAGKNSRTRDRP